MSNHGFGLLNIISSIINEERDGNDVAIARYLISNLRNSEAINVSAITERAHVTRSAVRTQELFFSTGLPLGLQAPRP